MKFESSHKTIIAYQAIDQINDSVTVLKHFIELNSKLLPALFDLKEKECPNQKECMKIKRIQLVFDSYCFTAESSVVLINSPILKLIYTTYQSIIHPSACNSSLNALLDFRKEYNRLKNDWNLIQKN
ncbi:MAG: hypothetical protein PHQ74_02060 [Crocinitomicaceae bacterium]|nr:hypothetical protein [Crocinitomicaceae bacterium]